VLTESEAYSEMLKERSLAITRISAKNHKPDSPLENIAI
jgi:hypothetical protein